MSAVTSPSFTSTRNACKLCTPLGACLAYKGIEGCVPLLHGSQGCATYIRRYMISHYKEPVDIASSSFGEQTAIFGGRENLFKAIGNITQQYQPKAIGIATTCLSETIGDDISMYLKEFHAEHEGQEYPTLIHVSTPSYTGTHAEGFYDTLLRSVETLAEGGVKGDFVNFISGMISTADIRHLQEIMSDFNLENVFLPDYSDTLDGPAWETYRILPDGGTPMQKIQSMGRAAATIELGRFGKIKRTAGEYLQDEFSIPRHRINLPIGIQNTDEVFQTLEQISGNPTPVKYTGERNRLIDAYADSHKYLSEKRAIVYGEEDFVLSLVDFLLEIGIKPVLCASGGNSGAMRTYIEAEPNELLDETIVMDDSDFMEMEETAKNLKADFVIGNSKGFKLANQLNLPLVRVGFPIHDRIGGSRILHVGYRGTQNIFDLIANTIIESHQDSSEVGYFYM